MYTPNKLSVRNINYRITSSLRRSRNSGSPTGKPWIVTAPSAQVIDRFATHAEAIAYANRMWSESIHRPIPAGWLNAAPITETKWLGNTETGTAGERLEAAWDAALNAAADHITATYPITAGQVRHLPNPYATGDQR